MWRRSTLAKLLLPMIGGPIVLAQTQDHIFRVGLLAPAPRMSVSVARR